MNKEQYHHIKFCWDKNITISPVPTQKTDHYKIEINNNGRAKLGTEIYLNNKKDKEKCVWLKIYALYKEIFNQLNKK